MVVKPHRVGAPVRAAVSLARKADIRPGYEVQIDSKLERLEAAIAKHDDQAHL